MSEDAPAAAPPEAAPQLELETEIRLPLGIELERLASGEERVLLRYPLGNRALVALPRVALFACGVFAVALAFRHHVFIAFWIFGLPFLRWLAGPARSSLLIGKNQLELQGARLFGGSIVIPRARIATLEVTRKNPWHLFQRAIRVRTVDERSAPLLVGMSTDQAQFLIGGLQRWLSEN